MRPYVGISSINLLVHVKYEKKYYHKIIADLSDREICRTGRLFFLFFGDWSISEKPLPSR